VPKGTATLDTPAINKAIEVAATAGGGIVLFPPGTYLRYSGHLESNVGNTDGYQKDGKRYRIKRLRGWHCHRKLPCKQHFDRLWDAKSVHLKLCNCDHFPNLIPDGPPLALVSPQQLERRQIPYALSGDPRRKTICAVAQRHRRTRNPEVARECRRSNVSVIEQTGQPGVGKVQSAHSSKGLATWSPTKASRFCHSWCFSPGCPGILWRAERSPPIFLALSVLTALIRLGQFVGVVEVWPVRP